LNRGRIAGFVALAAVGSGCIGQGRYDRGMLPRWSISLALACLLAGCAGTPSATPRCIPGDPGGSHACQAETYKRAF
jgi:hypothetical protein